MRACGWVFVRVRALRACVRALRACQKNRTPHNTIYTIDVEEENERCLNFLK